MNIFLKLFFMLGGFLCTSMTYANCAKKPNFEIILPISATSQVELSAFKIGNTKVSKDGERMVALAYRMEEDLGIFTNFEDLGNVSLYQDKVVFKNVPSKNVTESLQTSKPKNRIALIILSKEFLEEKLKSANIHHVRELNHKSFSEIEEVLGNPSNDSNITIVFTLSGASKTSATATCTCKGMFGGTSCCTSPTCKKEVGFCQSNPDCKQNNSCPEYTSCNCG